ncbi:FMN-binding [Shewanella denitrificans OS217]|jgi:Na+-translocating ferredoxin:NAD+ oxidoreductase RnfG subunit|uniref:FMN-binding n=1 Tax=Shewanella denitrificans (strain OS217 / ATCC BAA-1090 / DSM 15013) TaxID=318161 RepID=Q12RJ7_SHEDO|nr:FMN-binding protein [Shewanella denitrificans]ABE53929.1 FMN-binding [Shewanella denitrificans OS217]
MKLISLLLLGISFLFTSAQAEQVQYSSSQEFIQHAFEGELPKAKVFWLDDKAKAVIEEILSHSFNKMRLRYWQQGDASVWIMDEIGKEAPITVGVHVKAGAIVETKVLVYRESRGDEVRHAFFTDQFKAAKLQADNKLDKHIDGITGATLSVRALTKLSRIALWLDAHVNKTEASS